jgi:hypothetical protein
VQPGVGSNSCLTAQRLPMRDDLSYSDIGRKTAIWEAATPLKPILDRVREVILQKHLFNVFDADQGARPTIEPHNAVCEVGAVSSWSSSSAGGSVRW